MTNVVFAASIMAPTISHTISWLMVHFLWQGLLVGAGVYASSLLIRHSSSATQYRVYVAWLVLLAMCAPSTWWLAREPAQPVATNRQLVNFPSTDTPRALAGPIAATNANGVADVFHRPVTVFSGSSWKVIASGVYLVGLCLMLLRMVFAAMGLRRRKIRGEIVDSGPLVARLNRLCRQIQLPNRPSLRVCEQVVVPIVYGVIRPVILVPAFVLSGMTTEELDTILLHELAHIRRGDLLINCLQRVTESFLFFHPVTWYLSHRISVAREQCCDDIVLNRCERGEYASALVKLAEFVAGPLSGPTAALAATGSPSELRRRVTRILDGHAPSPTDRAGLALTLTCAMLISFSVVSVQAQVGNTKPMHKKTAHEVSEQHPSRHPGRSTERPISSQHTHELDLFEQGKTPGQRKSARTMLRSIRLANSVQQNDLKVALDAFLEGSGLTDQLIEYRFDADALIVHSSDPHFELIHAFLSKRKWTAASLPTKRLVYLRNRSAADVLQAIKINFRSAQDDFLITPKERLNALEITADNALVDRLAQFAESLDQRGAPAANKTRTQSDANSPAAAPVRTGKLANVEFPRLESAAWRALMWERIAHGQKLYDLNCKHCHGLDGNGKGPTSAFLKPKPRDFTKRQFKHVRFNSPHTLADLEKAILRGSVGTAMPSFELLSKHQVGALAEYVLYLTNGKKLPKEPDQNNLRFSPDIEKGMLHPMDRGPASKLRFTPEIERGMLLEPLNPPARR